MVFSFGFGKISAWPQFFSFEFVSNICTLGLVIVGLAFVSATLNKPDIDLSTTPDDS